MEQGSYGPIDLIYNPAASNTGSNPFDYSFALYFDGTTGGYEEIGLGYSSNGVDWKLYGKCCPEETRVSGETPIHGTAPMPLSAAS